MVQILPSPRPDPFAFATRDAIKSIVDTIGKAETKRQQIILNNKVMSIVAAGGDPEQITRDIAQAVISQDPQFDPGIAGFFQRVCSRFAQPPGQEFAAPLVRQALKQPTGLEREQKVATLEATKALTEKRQRGTELSPFEQSKAEKARNRDTKILNNPKALPVTKKAATRRLKGNLSLAEIQSGQDFSKFLKRKDKIKIGTLDKAFGEDAHKNALQRAKDKNLAQGISEESVEVEFNKWWDEQAETERARGDKRFEFVPRSQFGVTPLSTENIDLQLQTPPDARLDEFWPNLPDEEKLEIIEKLNASPTNIGPILQILRAG